MTTEPSRYVPNELLSRLVGFRLYSVQFVMDHVQLRFDGPTQDMPCLSCDVMPAVETPAGLVRAGEPGYADALVALVPGDVVATTETTGGDLRIGLTSGTVALHPRFDDYTGPEIAYLSGFADGRWMCWRPGEETFEDLA
ncbi:hypothetical protein [Cellulomonas dongxiuzhuiae]|uniref:DUF4262 domain-containing protein n=1 Tax=Cellulomonas dongxiuzhuiae TaxID=2819979 RepID=A0ABX8GKV3_9CELL|nr:hypothetical protein [Cellulomonas dongxiuzhuiae]MBO3088840.1 hypothetical protein [Cellulomonas dongxiuzhuiae]MBO3096399.1 hypothetical protein [Cellulomonas dongxiuzhuiae]QWC16808.1 hypothetical protein KKR89_03985 [Cellulomonas dongxiuzhuiae]